MGKTTDAARWRWNVHGHVVDVECAVPAITAAARRYWRGYTEASLPPGCTPTRGEVHPYDADAVVRHLAGNAERGADLPDGAELWHEPGGRGRAWVVDERWGLAEVDLPRRRWRAWVMSGVADGGVELLERAVLWPMAQLLRPRGLHVMRAASLSADGWGLLLVTPNGSGGLEPELARLTAEGLAPVGPRWTALREENDRVAMLRLPGPIAAETGPKAPGTPWPASDDGGGRWHDLIESTGSPLRHAYCDAVVLVTPGRRGMSELSPAAGAEAARAVRDAWPLPRLLPGLNHATLAAKLAQRAVVYHLSMSRDPDEFATLIDLIRPTSPTPGTRRRVEAA